MDEFIAKIRALNKETIGKCNYAKKTSLKAIETANRTIEKWREYND